MLQKRPDAARFIHMIRPTRTEALYVFFFRLAFVFASVVSKALGPMELLKLRAFNCWRIFYFLLYWFNIFAIGNDKNILKFCELVLKLMHWGKKKMFSFWTSGFQGIICMR